MIQTPVLDTGGTENFFLTTTSKTVSEPHHFLSIGFRAIFTGMKMA